MTRRRRIAAACGRVVESSWFDPLMLAIIALNAVTLALGPTTRSTLRSGGSCTIDEPADDERAHAVVIEERLRAMRTALDELERDVRVKP